MKLKMDDEMHRAVVDGNLLAIDDLLLHGTSINHMHGMRGTPLCSAISSKQLDVVDFLLSHKECDVNARDFDNEPPLCLAIRKGYNDIAEMLISHPNCDLNKIDPISGYPALCIAVKAENVDMVRELVDHKASSFGKCDMNKATLDDKTPLHLALLNRNKKLIGLLLDNACRLDIPDKSGFMALHSAVHGGEQSICDQVLTAVKVNSCLLVKDNTINLKTVFEGNTALHLACQQNDSDVLELVNKLIHFRCNINEQNRKGETPLSIACGNNNTEVAKLLLLKGASPNVVCCAPKITHHVLQNLNVSPLHVAVSYGNISLVEALVENGANINERDSIGGTPLALALSRSKSNITEYFLSAGHNFGLIVNSVDNAGNSPLFLVSRSINAGHFAQILIQQGCLVNEYNSKGETPLHAATYYDCCVVVDVLLKAGADPNIIIREGNITCLQICCDEDYTGTAKVLLTHGADIDTLDEGGDSLMERALENMSDNMIQLLIEAGFNLCTLHFSKQLIDGISKLHIKDIEVDSDDSYASDSDVSSVSSGYELPEIFREFRELKACFANMLTCPQSLKWLCRVHIHKYCRSMHIPFVNLNKVQYPEKLINYLLLQ